VEKTEIRLEIAVSCRCDLGDVAVPGYDARNNWYWRSDHIRLDDRQSEAAAEYRVVTRSVAFRHGIRVTRQPVVRLTPPDERVPQRGERCTPC